MYSGARITKNVKLCPDTKAKIGGPDKKNRAAKSKNYSAIRWLIAFDKNSRLKIITILKPLYSECALDLLY